MALKMKVFSLLVRVKTCYENYYILIPSTQLNSRSVLVILKIIRIASVIAEVSVTYGLKDETETNLGFTSFLALFK